MVVAVVVFTVSTDLRCGDDFTDTGFPFVVFAQLTTSLANADIFGACGAGVTGSGCAVCASLITAREFVDSAVAVVVFVVTTGLVLGYGFILTLSPLAACTGVRV